MACPQGGGCDIGAYKYEPIIVTLSVESSGTVSRATREVTVGDSVSCSAPTSVTLEVALSQVQTKRKTTVTVTGSPERQRGVRRHNPLDGGGERHQRPLQERGGDREITEVGSDPLNQVTQAVSLSRVK